MFPSLFQDHLQGQSLALSAYHASAARHMSVLVCGCMSSVCICIPCTCLCATAHRQVQGIQIQTEDIQPHTSTDI
jgi:hypothetical protein